MSLSEKALLVKEDFDEVYDKGKQEGYSDGELAVWSQFTNNWTRANYSAAFKYFGGEYIRPPKKIIGGKGATSVYETFRNNENIKKVEKDYFDFSKCSPSQTSSTGGNYYTFYYCTKLEELEDVGLPAGYYYDTFRYCWSLKKIEVLRFKKDTKISSQYWMYSVSKLEDVTIEGEIGVSIWWSDCPKLTVESLISIITHLVNYAGTTSEGTCTLTLASASKTKLEAEGATSPNGNTWAEYIGDLGWVLK